MDTDNPFVFLSVFIGGSDLFSPLRAAMPVEKRLQDFIAAVRTVEQN
jgi:hypothetical protein